MHRRHDPSHLSSEATAGLHSQHACGYAGFGLGETGDLLMDPGLPQPSSVIHPGAVQPRILVVSRLEVAVVGRGRPRDDAG